MKILRKLSEIERITNPVVTIGTFDGIHLGHQKILQHLHEKKRQYRGNSYLITFEPHPQLVLKSKAKPIHILTRLEEKIKILQSTTLDYLLVLEFTQELSEMTGERFIEEILLDKIGMVDVVIGYDHAFGYRRSGNISTLKKYSEKNNFDVNVVEPFILNDLIIKSSLIRQIITEGQVNLARQYLGRPYQIRGTVVKGRGRGKKLTFPTANLELENTVKLTPGNGIYAVQLEVDENLYNGAVSIGVRPTFNEVDKTIEAYIFNFNRNIYGQKITIKFIQKIRDEHKFESEEDLISQMKDDVVHAKTVLNQV